MTFGEFVVIFNKVYLDDAERLMRQDIFDATVERINRENSDPSSTFQQKVTWAADRTQAELALPKLKLETFIGGASATTSGKVGALQAPASLDWRDQGKVGAVKNQGSCGSCWAFASTAVAESYIAISTNSAPLDLSEEYVLECSAGSSCNGGNLASPMQLIATKGIPSETAYPYRAVNSGLSNTPKTAGICTTTNVTKLVSGTNANVTLMVTTEQLKSFLTVGPVAVLFYASASGFSSYSSGIYSRCPSTLSWNSLDHTVQVVGYDTSNNWIIKNSWGTGWGIDGYAIIKNSNDCGIRMAVYQFTTTSPSSLVVTGEFWLLWAGYAVLALLAML